MKPVQFLLFVLFITQLSCQSNGQTSTQPDVRPSVINPEFDQRLERLLSFTVPVMGVNELEKRQKEVVLFDTRKREEYEISHIPGARYLGYKEFDSKLLSEIPKDSTIVLYCSVGYRSEKIGEKIQALGYTQVYNLYGSIFEWANKDLPLVDKNGDPTHQVHTYNRIWSKWVNEGKVEKVW